MRFDGKLDKWNDDRGFGFITPARGGEPVFVHVSAFPRDGRRPQPGEALSFEVEPAGDGKKRAIKVERPGTQRRAGPRPPAVERVPLRRTNPLLADELMRRGEVLPEELPGHEDGRRWRRHPLRAAVVLRTIRSVNGSLGRAGSPPSNGVQGGWRQGLTAC